MAQGRTNKHKQNLDFDGKAIIEADLVRCKVNGHPLREWWGTQAEYDALEVIDEYCRYYIVEG